MAKKKKSTKSRKKASGSTAIKSAGSSKSDVSNGKGCAVLSYFLIGMIWWLLDENMRKNKFATFHFKQALILLAAYIALGFLETFLIISIIGIFLAFLIWIAGIVLFVLTIFGIVYSAQGKTKPVPLIGKLALEWFNF